jgi:hypothetical protein
VNSLILNGVVVGNPKASQTKEGAAKCVFVVETDGRDLPLRFNVLAFGGPGETASKLIDGDEILLSGRMVGPEAVLHAGRELAKAILQQWQRVWTAPLNLQEQQRLDALQGAWVNYESEAVTHGIEVEKEFDTRLLRPPLQKVPDLAKMRRAHGVLEWNLLSLGLARKRDHKNTEPDEGFWGAAGPGI